MKKQALLIVIAMSFATSSFALTKRGSIPETTQYKRAKSPADCLYPSRVKLNESGNIEKMMLPWDRAKDNTIEAKRTKT